jgi:hypothetical protein
VCIVDDGNEARRHDATDARRRGELSDDRLLCAQGRQPLLDGKELHL